MIRQRNKLNGTAAILLLLIATLGCSNALGWMMFNGTKWKATSFDPEGDSVRVELQSGGKARVTLIDATGRELGTETADWSNDYKVITMTWGKGRYQGTLRSNVIEGSLTVTGSGLRVPLTLWQD